MLPRPLAASAVLLVAAVSSPPCAPARADAPREFLSGYAGVLPTAAADLARNAFDAPDVRALLERLEEGPRPRAEAARALAGGALSLENLLRLRLLRLEGSRVAIGFAYFPAADVRRMNALADRLAPSLAAAFESRRAELDRVLARYSVASVPRDRLAFALVAGFGLNWDALTLTREMGLRRPVLVEGKG